MSGVTISRIGDHVVAVQEAEADSAEAERLLRAAETLGRISHPCVVELVEVQTGPTVRLATGFVSAESWADHPPDDADATAAFAQLCSVLADLHDAGIAHGSLQSRHVLVRGDGRSVICGFGDSGEATPEALAADLAALADLAGELSATGSVHTSSALGSVSRDLRSGKLNARSATLRLDRLGQRSGRGRSPGLRGFAGRSRARQPAGRRRIDGQTSGDEARSAGAALRARLAASMPGRASGAAGEGSGARRRVGAVLAGAGVVALLGLAAVTLTGGGTDTAVSVQAGAGDNGGPSGDAGDAVGGGFSGSASTGAGGAVTGPDRLEITDQPEVAVGTPEVEHNGRRYAVGRPGDLVVMGDWSCDGIETPAVLRAATAEVAVFARWPSDGSALRPDRVEVVDGAVRLAVDESAGCDRLRVHTPDGSRLLTLEEQ